MTTVTEAVVLLSNAAYQALSSGQKNVRIQPEEGRIRVHVGQALPDAATNNWFPLEDGEPMQFHGLAASDIVYAKTDGSSTEASTPVYPTTVRVLRR